MGITIRNNYNDIPIVYTGGSDEKQVFAFDSEGLNGSRSGKEDIPNIKNNCLLSARQRSRLGGNGGLKSEVCVRGLPRPCICGRDSGSGLL